jgi:RNA 2',3'-cyclic 3'-phosphodiesterase
MNTENTDRTKQWRMFCAFELPEDLRRAIAEHSRKVREAVADAAASWSRPENIHLTVKFFGNVDPGRVPVISATAARVVKEFSSIQIAVGKTGVFPRPSRPQVLWIGVEDQSGGLLKLQQRLEDAFAREGFPKEDRAFRPHLTIARIRRPQNADHLAEAHLGLEFSNVAVSLNELVLIRSELSPKGSQYTAISRHRLEH